MRRLLPLLAFAWIALGQQDAPLVGLPEYGVTLTGTQAEPTLVNNSDKGLIGYVVRLAYASGGSDYRRNLQTRSLRLNVTALGSVGGGFSSICCTAVSQYLRVRRYR